MQQYMPKKILYFLVHYLVDISVHPESFIIHFFSAGQSDESIVLNMVTDMLFRVPEVVEQHGHSTSSEKSQSVSKGGTTGSSKDPLAMPTTINGLMKFVNDAKMPSQNQFEKKKPVGGQFSVNIG